MTQDFKRRNLKIKRRNLKVTATVALLLLSPVALLAKPISIGMTKAEIAKLYPSFAQYFQDESPALHRVHWPLHGMTGEAAFAFAKGKLLVFTWEHPKDHKEGMTKADMKTYNALLRGLQSDWGKGKTRRSPFNPSVTESTWRLPHSRASIRYNLEMIRVQLVDADYLNRAKSRKPTDKLD